MYLVYVGDVIPEGLCIMFFWICLVIMLTAYITKATIAIIVVLICIDCLFVVNYHRYCDYH